MMEYVSMEMNELDSAGLMLMATTRDIIDDEARVIKRNNSYHEGQRFFSRTLLVGLGISALGAAELFIEESQVVGDYTTKIGAVLVGYALVSKTIARAWHNFRYGSTES
jgi:hypothetical protein